MNDLVNQEVDCLLYVFKHLLNHSVDGWWWGSGGPDRSLNLLHPAVITDIHCDYLANTPSQFQLLVNGLPTYTFTAASGVTSTGCCGPYGQTHNLQHGIPVPCGAHVRIQATNISGDTGFNISGYFL